MSSIFKVLSYTFFYNWRIFRITHCQVITLEIFWPLTKEMLQFRISNLIIIKILSKIRKIGLFSNVLPSIIQRQNMFSNFKEHIEKYRIIQYFFIIFIQSYRLTIS